MLREALLIVPVEGPNGEDLSSLHLELSETLADAFGGLILTETVRQPWTDYQTGLVHHDDATEYRISRHWTDREVKRLAIIAADVCRRADHECVTVRDPDGALYDVAPAAAPVSPKWAEAV